MSVMQQQVLFYILWCAVMVFIQITMHIVQDKKQRKLAAIKDGDASSGYLVIWEVE